MENVSKVLLIVAGVLITVLLVTFGVRMFNSSAGDTVKQVQSVGDSISEAGEDATDKLGVILGKIGIGSGNTKPNHSGSIPDGGEYKSGSQTYGSGEQMPSPQDGDTYTYGDYIYTYYALENYWNVSVIDTTQSKYGEILHNINEKEIGNLRSTFKNCYNLTKAPSIPETVEDISNCFYGCKELKAMPTIPSGVNRMNYTFYGCENLSEVTDIPDSVYHMAYCFYNCSSITSVTIPKSVTSVIQAFVGCDSLTSITIKKSAGSFNLNGPPSGLTPAQISSVVWAP